MLIQKKIESKTLINLELEQAERLFFSHLTAV